MKSKLHRPGTDGGLTAAEANEKGRQCGLRAEFPERTEKWDYMSADQINAMDGTNDLPRTPILSGGDAAEHLRNLLVGRAEFGPAPRCNCEERHAKNTENYRLPKVREDGICLGCGVER